MVHGDDKGLRLPPNIAPIQIVVIPIYKNDEDLNALKKYLEPVLTYLSGNQNSFYFDDRKKLSPGFKFNEWEMKGVPLRLEVGMRDLENHSLTVARRDTNDKKTIDFSDYENILVNSLADIQVNLFNEAKKFKDENTFIVSNYESFKNTIQQGGFIKCGWDGTSETEKKIKNETKATIRCIPLKQNISDLKCIYSKNDAKYEVIFARAY